MLINKITIYNFRQYKGRQVLEFSTSKEKNVTVVLGDNTSGKTTLIQAFNWCLYDNTNFKTKELLNSEIAATMSQLETKEVYVEIELTHEDKIYVIRRKQLFKSTISGQVRGDVGELKVEYKEPSGEMQEVDSHECKNTINKILPVDLSEYFFYDGERDLNNKGDVVSAVRGLMGIDVINETVDHFNPKSHNSVISKLNREIDVGKDEKIIKLRGEIDNKKIELANYDKRYREVEKEIDFFLNRKEELAGIVLANSKTKRKQDEKSQLEKDIVFLEKQTHATETDLVKAFSKDSCKFFALPLYKNIKEVLDGAKHNAEGIPHMRSKSIDYILERGKCICGCDLTKNQGAEEFIRFEQSLLPPKHIGSLINSYKKEMGQNERLVEDYESNIKRAFGRIRENQRQLDEKCVRISNVSKDIIGDINVGKFELEAEENNGILVQKEKLLLSIRDKKTACNRDIDNIEREIDKNALVSDKNARINKELAYANEIYKLFKERYDLAESNVKTDLYNSINELFAKMYHGERKVEIDDKYRIILKVDNGNGYFTTDTSPGLDTVKNFAFICGLVDLARRKAREVKESTDEIAFNTEPYPIVMDAPFSKADDTHIKNISEVLPEVAEQVILVVMKKDWGYAKDAMGEKLGKLYEINKFSESCSTVGRIDNV